VIQPQPGEALPRKTLSNGREALGADLTGGNEAKEINAACQLRHIQLGSVPSRLVGKAHLPALPSQHDNELQACLSGFRPPRERMP
jgi:hypothetical protein